MKFLILLGLIGLSTASFLKRAAPLVDGAVEDMLDGMSRVGSLRGALDMRDALEMDQVEDDIKTELGKHLKEQLDNLLEKIKDAVEKGKAIKEDLIEKVKEVRKKMKEIKLDLGNKAKELIEKLKEKAKDHLKTILEKLGLGKRSLNDLLEEVRNIKFEDIIDRIKEKLMNNENIQKIREYLRNLATNNPLIKALKDLFEKLKDADIRKFINALLHRDGEVSRRGLNDIWKKIEEFLREKHLEMKERYVKFGEWMKNIWNKALDEVKDKHQLLKDLAIRFIASINDISRETAKEGISFFKPYKPILGSLWDQILEMLRERFGED